MSKAPALAVVLAATLLAPAALAQTPAAPLPPTAPPTAPTSAPAPAAAPAPASAPTLTSAEPSSTTKADKPADGTITFAKPDHAAELGARMGAVFGGEVTPVGLPKGNTSASWILVVDGDYIVHPFFSVGAFGHFTNQGYKLEKSGAEGDITTITLGVSAKARIPLSANVTGRAGLYVGRNFLSGTVSSVDISGGGLDMGLTAEVSGRVSNQVAITGQFGFFSQVSGSVTPSGGKEADLAFTPKPFLTVGPSIYF